MSVSDIKMNAINEMKAIVVSLNNYKTLVEELFSETKFDITNEIQTICGDTDKLITSINGLCSRVENYNQEQEQDIDPVQVDESKLEPKQETEPETEPEPKPEPTSNLKPKAKRVYKKKTPKTNVSVVDPVSQVNAPKSKPQPKSNPCKVIKSAFILPFTGVIEEVKCHSIRYNYGLHTQCQNKKLKSGDYCSVCQKNIDQTPDNKPPNGDIRDRLNVPLLDYVDPKGKKTVPYIKVISKLKVTREQAEQEAMKFGFTIPDEHWIEVKKTKPKVTKESVKPKPKPKPNTTNTKPKVDEQSEVDTKPNTPDSENNVMSDKDKVNKRGRPIKPVVSIDETTVLKSDIKEELQSAVNTVTPNIETKDEELEDIHCEEFELNNQTYLLSSDNKLYDINTEEYIGSYNPNTNSIVS